ncbi:MAG: hypothetical protein EHM13_14055, partial [Acidobacteria bacterium]
MRRAAAVPVLAVGLLFSWLPGETAGRSQDRPADVSAAGQVIFRAMQDEMERAMRGLLLEGEPPPYYISCAIDDVTTSRIRASLGSLVEDSTGRARLLRVQVRVGDYAFDNSGFLSNDAMAGVMPGWATTSGIIATLDDDYHALRRQIWLMADASYKQAVNTYARKRALYGNRAGTDTVPDFARQAPAETIVDHQPTPPGLDRWRDAVVRLSAAFRASDAIRSSQASLSVSRGARYFLNSEGTRSATPIASAVLVVPAEAQADDAMRLRDVVSAVETSPDDFPPVADLERRVGDMAARLAALRAAPVADDYTGPVLLEGQA